MKRCAPCGQFKPLSEFSSDRTKRDGRGSRCTACNRAKARTYRAANLEKERERQRVWRESNREELRQAAAIYRRENREAHLAAVRASKRKRPERYRAYQARRRARMVGEAYAELISELVGNPCVYCGSSEHIEIDHIVPLSRGGAHIPENLAPACRSCNRSKGAKLLSEWLVAC